MILSKRLVIAQHERGLKFHDRSFVAILEPGVHRISKSRTVVQVYDLTTPEFDHAGVDFLLKGAPDTMAKHFDVVETGEHEVGVAYKNGQVAWILAPGKRQLYWRGPIVVRVVKHDITHEFEIAAPLAKVLVRAKQPLASVVSEAVAAIEVPDTAVGLLIVDGELAKVLTPGLHAFWKFQRALKTELV